MIRNLEFVNICKRNQINNRSFRLYKSLINKNLYISRYSTTTTTTTPTTSTEPTTSTSTSTTTQSTTTTPETTTSS